MAVFPTLAQFPADPPPALLAAFDRAVAALRASAKSPPGLHRPSGRPPRAPRGGSLFIDAANRSVHVDDDPLEHVNAARAADVPAHGGALPQDLLDCLSWLARTAPLAITAFRRDALTLMHSLDVALRPLTEWMWSLNPHGTQRKAAGDLHVALMAALVEANDWPDTRLPYDLIFGMQIIGRVPDTGVFRPLPLERTLDADEALAAFLASNAAEVARQRDDLRRRARAGPRSVERLRAVHTATRKEVRKGLLSPALSFATMNRKFGRRWRSIPRFLVEQHKMDGTTKLRPCDNAKRSGHNAATFMEETNPLCSVFIIAEMLRAYAAACDDAYGPQPSVPAVNLSVVDLKDAYRHVPCRDVAYTAVAVWNPDADRVDYHLVYGLNFGLTAAVVQFSRVPAVIEMAARRHLLIPMGHYLDDMFPLDKVGVSTGARSFDALITFVKKRLGGQVHPTKQDPPALLNPLLGVQVDLTDFATSRRVLFATLPEREGALIRDLQAARSKDFLSVADAQSMAGKWQFATMTMASRAGRAALLPLIHRANGRDETLDFSQPLQIMADFLTHLTQHAPPRCVPVNRMRDRPILLYTDASGGKDGIPPRLGAVLVDGPTVLYCAADVPPDIITMLGGDHAQKISQLEGYGWAAGFLTFFANLSGGHRRLLGYIDNTPMLSALVNGYSSKGTMAMMANFCHTAFAWAHTDYWLEYVPSKANIADGPSRHFYGDVLALRGVEVTMTLPSAQDIATPQRIFSRNPGV